MVLAFFSAIGFEVRYQSRQRALWLIALGVTLVDAVGLATQWRALGGAPDRVFGALWAGDHQFNWALLFLYPLATLATDAAAREDETRQRQAIDVLPTSRAARRLGQAVGALVPVLVAFLAVPMGVMLALIASHTDARSLVAALRGQFLAMSIGSSPFLVSAGLLIFATAGAGRSRLTGYGMMLALILAGGVTIQAPTTAHLPVWMMLADPLGALAFNSDDGFAVALRAVLWMVAAAVAVLASAYAPVPGRLARRPPAGGWPCYRCFGPFMARWVHEIDALVHSRVLHGVCLLFAGYAAILLWITALGQDPPRYLTTAMVVQSLKSSFGAGVWPILAFLAAELVWAERAGRTQALIDVTAASSTTLLGAKLAALVTVSGAILAVTAVLGALAQAVVGGPPVDLAAYVLWYGTPGLLQAFSIGALALCAQVLAPGRLSGWLLLGGVGAVAGLSGRTSIGPWLGFAGGPRFMLTDMNGQGGYGAIWTAHALYWTGAGLVLCALALLAWRRGEPAGLRIRLRDGGRQTPRLAATVSLIGLTIMATTGWRLPRSDAEAGRKTISDAEIAVLAQAPQPSLVTLRANLALHPSEGWMAAEGQGTMINRTGKPLSCVLLRFPGREVEVRSLAVEGMTEVRRWGDLRLWRFCGTPLADGETRALTYRSRLGGAPGPGAIPAVAGNGTDVRDTDFAPFIGLADLAKAPADARHPLLARDRVMFDLTVSTDADQTVVAPGRRVSETLEEGRRVARFISDRPQLNFLAAFSAHYHRVAGDGVVLYLHPGHTMNGGHLREVAEAALADYGARFSPYAGPPLQIVETPGYRDSVQSLPGLVAMGERSTAIIGDLRAPGRLDYPGYLLAHEIAHQWWGHALRPSNEPGSALLTEGLADYSALSFLERRCGRGCVAPFLKRMWADYLRQGGGRGREPALNAMTTERHLRYGKAGGALFLLRDQLGSEATDTALAGLLATWRNEEGRFPNATDLANALRAAARDEAQDRLVTDLLQRVTTYDLALERPRVRVLAGRGYEVTVTAKARTRHSGATNAGAPFQGVVEVGVETARGLEVQRFTLAAGAHVVRMVTAAPPLAVMIDPANLWPDVDRQDNRVILR